MLKPKLTAGLSLCAMSHKLGVSVMAKSTEYGSTYTLPFEKPIVELQKQITVFEQKPDVDEYAEEIASLKKNRE